MTTNNNDSMQMSVFERVGKDMAAEIVPQMEKHLAHAIRMAEEGYRGDAPYNAMDALNELFDTSQPLHIWERCLDICTEFHDLEEGSIAPRYFLILRALILEAKMRTQ
jgi:hypothetical protein